MSARNRFSIAYFGFNVLKSLVMKDGKLIPSQKSIGLVLSGGAVRGMAHIGVIKFMEEIGVSAEYVSGTSVGALVGCFYAAGYSAEEMLDFFIKTPIFRLQSLTYKKPGIVDLEKLFPTFLKYFPENRFEVLQRKLFVTATDILRPQETVFSKGELIHSVLASSSMPLIFCPTKTNGSLYIDGGVVNNFPIEVLQPFCDKIIGVHVSPLLDLNEDKFSTGLSVMERAYHVGLFVPAKQKFSQCNVFVSPHELTKYKSFDMKRIKDICQVGYEMAKKELTQFNTLKLDNNEEKRNPQYTQRNDTR